MDGWSQKDWKYWVLLAAIIAFVTVTIVLLAWADGPLTRFLEGMNSVREMD